MPSGYFAPSRSIRYFLRPTLQLELTDFSGGLNLRDAPTELGATDSPDCMNVTLDERGGVVKRLGRTRLNAGGALPGTPQQAFFWKSAGVEIFQVGATIYKTPDNYASWSSIATLSTSDRMAFCDFNGKLVGVHVQDGVFVYDGATWTLATAAVKGSCIAPWQNKVFVGGDLRAGNNSVVWWSNAGNPSIFTTGTDFNGLREKDDAPITALGLGQGQDVAGRPGLLVFKEESAYRINSSATGAFTTIDGSAGAAGALAVVTCFGVTCVINKLGIFTTDANGVNELTLASGKIPDYFRPDALNFGAQGLWCAGVYKDRVLFSVPWGAGQASNNRTLEFHPQLGWIVPHDFGASAFTTYSKNDQKLHAASPNAAYVYEQFKSGSDDGAAISARYQTRWIIPRVGMLNSFRRLRLGGRGAFSLFTKLDFDQGQGELNAVSLLGTAFTWNDAGAVWNNPGMIWGPTTYEDYADFQEPGFGRAIAFNMTHVGTQSATGPKILEDGPAPEIGAFAFYSLTLDYIDAGYA